MLRTGASAPPRPGDGLLHPLPIAAIGVLILNDHWWKSAFGNWWTGKISDFAGMLFFPLLLQALWEVGRAAARVPFGPSLRALICCTTATATFFAASNLWTPAAEVYRVGLGLLQWPFRALSALLTGHGLPAPVPVALWMDPSDLVALPFVGIAFWIGWRRVRKSERVLSGL